MVDFKNVIIAIMILIISLGFTKKGENNSLTLKNTNAKFINDVHFQGQIVVLSQLVLMKLYDLKKFDIFSLLRNLIVFFAITTSVKYKRYTNLLIIPIMYFIKYNYPSYLGQDILAFPITLPWHIAMNLQKVQTLQMKKNFLDDAHISLNDYKYNFWYEYYNFVHGEDVYYLL